MLFQCRKYKGSEQIKKKAEYIYCKFKQFYLTSNDENVSLHTLQFSCLFYTVLFLANLCESTG